MFLSLPAPVRPPRRVGHRSLSGLAIAAVVASSAGLVSAAAATTQSRAVGAHAIPAHFFTVPLTADTFSRTVRSGWGRSPQAGWYRSSAASGHALVAGGMGQFVGIRPGTAAEYHLPGTHAADVSVRSTVGVPRLSHGARSGIYLALEMRVQPDSSAYTVTLYANRAGRATLLVAHRNADGTSRTLLAHSAGRVLPNARYRLQGAIEGQRIWARVWRVCNSAAAWHTVTDSTPISAPGAVGFIAYDAAGGTPITARLYGLYARRGHGSSAPSSPPPAPSSSAPAPSSSAPAPSSSAPAPSSSAPAPSSSDPVPSSSAPVPSSSDPVPSSSDPVPSSSAPAPSSSEPVPSSSDPGPSSSAPAPSSSAPAPPAAVPPAGSAALGSTSYPVPAGAVYVATTGNDGSGTGTRSSPFATVRRALQSVAAGGTVVVRGGTYHQNTFVGNSTDATIESYPGEVVWFDGSVPVTAWTASGGDWVHTGWTTQFDSSASFDSGSNAGDFVNPAYPLAAHPDQMFVDGVQLTQVAANPGPGQFAVDYTADTLTVGTDPNGHDVRASDLTQAFVVAGRVTLRGFGVRRYATPLPLIGTVYFGGSTGNSVVQNVIITDNATVGLSSSTPGEVFDHVTASNNGMTGIAAEHDDGGIIENSLMSGNNTQHFNAAPAAAGMKVGRLNGITIRDNVVENNLAISGIWTDENTINFVITGNTVLNNGNQYGIENELSDTGIVADNTISGSRYGYTAFDSGHIQVYNNDVQGNSVWDVGLTQDNRYLPGMGTAGANVNPSAADPWLCDYVTVVNNNFGTAKGAFQFYALDKQTGRPASSMHIVIQGNLFQKRVTSTDPWVIGWGGSDNVAVSMYATPEAFDAAQGYAWTNWVSSSAPSTVLDTGGVPLPADVAAVVGQPVGSTHVGTF